MELSDSVLMYGNESPLTSIGWFEKVIVVTLDFKCD